MNKDHQETIRIRAISVGFAVLALGVFKPFGLGAWKWEACAHLLLIWVLGFGVCFLTEVILKCHHQNSIRWNQSMTFSPF